MELASVEGAGLLNEYCTKERRTYVEVLSEFPSARPPFLYLVHMIPPLRPRHFSIASSLAAHPGRLQLIVALVKYKTPLRRTKVGVCSEWLSSLRPSDCGPIPVWWVLRRSARLPPFPCPHTPLRVYRGSMSLPDDPSLPVLLIGPGTGVAPIRAMAEERAVLAGVRADLFAAEDARVDPSLGAVAPAAVGDASAASQSHVLIGCRSRAKDWYFGRQWRAMAAAGAIASLSCAFSRDQEGKVYVTHLLREMGERVFESVCIRGGLVFVAGNAKSMPQDVRAALVDVIAEHGEVERQEAERYVSSMAAKRRLVFEVW